MIRSVGKGSTRFEYVLVRSVRRDILLKALPGGETRVYAPEEARLKDIDAIVKAHISELKDMHDRLNRQLAENKLMHPMSEGSRVCIEGEVYELELIKGEKEGLRLENGKCILRLKSIDDEEVVRAYLRSWLTKLALTRFRERLTYYAPRLNVQFYRVTIREQKSRWGSCSQKQNLNFNWKLIMAPKEVLDYVVIHELCHLIEFNHSERFWSLVEGQMSEYKYWKRWLKEHGKELGVE